MLRTVATASLVLAGCFGGSNDGAAGAGAGTAPPEGMVVQLAWDMDPLMGAFIGGTCAGAGVDSMEYSLSRTDGPTFYQVGLGGGCRDELELDVEPGECELDVRGFDADGDERWTTTCAGLAWEEVGEHYLCDVPRG